MPETIERRIGLIYARLHSIHRELGEAALDRSLAAVLQALGAAAMREAEERAAILATRRKARPGIHGITPSGQRRIEDGWHREIDD